jgi:hypothetical protein
MAPRKRIPYDPGQSGIPNPQRAEKGDEFELMSLTPPGAPPVYRCVQKAPLTAPESRDRAFDDVADGTSRRRKPAATALDRALEECEVKALYRFVIGTMVAEKRMRLKYDNADAIPVHVKSEDHNRLPFSERERKEIGYRQRVFAALPFASQRDIEIFTDQIMPRANGVYITPIDFGKYITRSSDERVARGGYVGYFKKLAQHINEIYVSLEMDDFRKTIGSKPVNRKRLHLFS